MRDPPRILSRRRFWTRLGKGLLAAAALIFAWPWLRRVLLPEGVPPSRAEFVDIGSAESFSGPAPVAVRLALPGVADDARPVVFIAHAARGEPRVLSGVCPHMNCIVGYEPEADRFHCGCHNSIFDRDGRRLAGPAQRDMDPLPRRIEHGRLLVQWKRYVPGLAERVEG